MQAEKRDKQTDAGGNCLAHCVRNRRKNFLTQSGDREKNKDDAVSQDKHQCIGVGKAEGKTDRVDKICVQAHSGGLRQRKICQQSDEYRTDDRRNRCCDINRAVAYLPGCNEHVGVDHQDISHCHEGGQTGKDFRSNRCVMAFQPKKLFHEITSHFKFRPSQADGRSV